MKSNIIQCIYRVGSRGCCKRNCNEPNNRNPIIVAIFTFSVSGISSVWNEGVKAASLQPDNSVADYTNRVVDFR